jgi:hypothetical protein
MNQTIDRSELGNLLIAKGVPMRQLMLKDRFYNLIDLSDVTLLFRSWLQYLPDSMVHRKVVGESSRLLPVWMAETWDCDNHSLDFTTFACRSNAHTRLTGGVRGGLALGRISYIGNSNGIHGGHAINSFVDHKKRVRFFDPGKGSEVVLNRTELSSIRDALFV